MAFTDLRHILMEVLPSCAVVEQGRILGIQSQLQKIHGHLWALNAMIMDADIRALKEDGPEDWVANMSETMVELEDLLDSIIERQERAAATTDLLSRTFLAGTREAFRLRAVRKLKKLRRRLDELISEGNGLHLRKEMLDSMDPCKDEYWAILRDEVVGRDQDMEKIVEILKQGQEEEEEEEESFVIAIHDVPFVIATRDESNVHAGRGKTALAQMIYHHPWVKQHFQERIWVDMSDFGYSFDIIGIAREFARAIAKAEACSHLQSLTNLQEFWVFLEQRLSGSRYLLFLDHLHPPDDWDEWNQLQCILLRVGGPGSTVLVTTSSAFLSSNSVREYRLNRLRRDAWVGLFLKYAFMSRPDDQDRLEKPVSEILLRWAQKTYSDTRSSPLAAKSFGYAFAYIEWCQWQNKLGHLLTKFNEDEKLLVFLIFLHHTPARLVRVQLYGLLRRESLREEDFMNMMFAEGLALNSRDKRTRLNYLEKISKKGLHFAGNLFMGSAELLKTRYCSRMSIGQNALRIPKQCRHLCLSFHCSNALLFPTVLFEANKKLRTLIFLREEEDTVLVIQKSQTIEIPRDMFANLVHLRILHLRDIPIQHLPSTIGKLMYLRYLNLSRTNIETLPPSICNMWNLQVLNLAHCEKLKKLPARIHRLWKLKVLDLSYCGKLRILPTTITTLVNLQELYLEGCLWLVQLPEGFNNMKRLAELNMQKCISLTRIPRGIGQLTDIIRLSGYIAYDDYIGISALAELKTLVHLKELRIQGLERVSSSDLIDVQGIKLYERSILDTLSLMWQWSDYMEEKDVLPEILSQQQLQLQLIQDLEPNPRSLKMLEIISYMGSKLPGWMINLKYLKEIRLVNLKRCEKLPPLGHLLLLEIIEISGIESISTVNDTYDGRSFPCLRQLTLSQMPQLEKWIARERILTFLSWIMSFLEDMRLKSLKNITLIQCPKFKLWEFLGYCQDLLSLELWLSCGILLTHKFAQKSNVTFKTLKIVGCQELRFLPEHMRQFLHELQELRIIWCHELISLPDWLEELKHLKQVIICGCTKLSRIPRGLKDIATIQNCPKLRLE